MKQSKVLPLFKSVSKDDPSSYRPVSALPALSKIFDKIILDQLSVYFAKYHFLRIEQYGFTMGRSNTNAGIALLKHIFEAWAGSQNANWCF